VLIRNNLATVGYPPYARQLISLVERLLGVEGRPIAINGGPNGLIYVGDRTCLAETVTSSVGSNSLERLIVAAERTIEVPGTSLFYWPTP
jgi:hypothetical protein